MITIMKRSMSIVVSAVLIILVGSCATSGEIPITTNSEEARALFIQGRDLIEQQHVNEARGYFDRALELDPDFALAHLYYSYGGIYDSEADQRKHLEKAVALAGKVSEGERLQIEQVKAILQEKDYGRQLELSQELVKKYPKDKRVHSDLGALYYTRSEYERAITELEASIALDPDFAPPYNMLGYTYADLGDYEQAVKMFNEYIRLIPDSPNPYDSKAELYMKMGRFEDAIEYYQKALDRDSTFSSANRGIGTSLVFLGRFDEGRKAFRSAMATDVTPLWYVYDWDLIVRSYLHQGDFPGAIAAVDEALALAHERNLPTWITGSHLTKGQIYFEMGNLDAAAKSLAALRESMQDAEYSPFQESLFEQYCLLNEAKIASKRQAFGSALNKAEEYKALLDEIKDSKSEAKYHGLMGLIRLDQGDHQKAVEHFSQSDPDDPYTVYYHGVAQAKLGNDESAQDLYSRAANWNENGFGYAIIRDKAFAALD